ncbi:unnamed protein product, partial [Rangifer tarandus platyrhynchus]
FYYYLHKRKMKFREERSPALQLPEPLAPGLSPALAFALSKRNRLRRRNALGAETGARALCADPDNLLRSFQGERKGFQYLLTTKSAMGTSLGDQG